MSVQDLQLVGRIKELETAISIWKERLAREQRINGELEQALNEIGQKATFSSSALALFVLPIIDNALATIKKL